MVDLECAIVLLPLDRVALFLLEATHDAALIALDLGTELPPEDELQEEVEQRHRELAEEQPGADHGEVEILAGLLHFGERRGMLSFTPLHKKQENSHSQTECPPNGGDRGDDIFILLDFLGSLIGLEHRFVGERLAHLFEACEEAQAIVAVFHEVRDLVCSERCHLLVRRR